MIHTDQGRKDGLEIPRIYSSDETNPMGFRRKILLCSEEGRSYDSKPDHNKNNILFTPENISLVPPEEILVCHSQGIITNRYQGRKLVLDVSRVSADHYSNIIGHHRNALLHDEVSNKFYKPDPDTASKPNIAFAQCDKYIINNTFNINPNTTGSNFSSKDYGTPITLPTYRKKSQPGGISRN